MSNLATRHIDAAESRPSAVQRWNAVAYDPFLALGERWGMRDRRRVLLAAARGRVLEIGAGTGLNLPHYTSAVDELVLTEPDAGMLARLRRRLSALPSTTGVVDPRTARVLDAPTEAIPFPDGSFDTAVTTMVLCTVPDPVAAVAELRRVVRPGGHVLVIEHVRADGQPRLARWQRRLHAPWSAFAAGCRCDQDTAALLANAGFAVHDLARETWHGMPAIVHPLLVGALELPRAGR